MFGRRINLAKEIRKERKLVKASKYIDTLNNDGVLITPLGLVVIKSSPEHVHKLGIVFGCAVQVMFGLGPGYMILTDQYAKEYEQCPHFREFIIAHETGHLFKRHLENTNKVGVIKNNIQTYLGIGSGIRNEFEADEYAASILGKDVALGCLIFMKKNFYTSAFQFLQLNARIKNLKRK